jgi:hypothetical protein
MREVLVMLFIHGVGGMLAHLHQRWGKRPNIPYVAKESRWPPYEATLVAWRAEIARIAASNQSLEDQGLTRLAANERIIFSAQVSLYEDRSTRRILTSASMRSRPILWQHRASSGKVVKISLLDRGTLLLTHRRFIFASARRRREFPLDELTHYSSTSSDVALARRGHHGIAYFKGIGAHRIAYQVSPGENDNWDARHFSFNFTGNDLREILHILQTDPLPPPT